MTTRGQNLRSSIPGQIPVAGTRQPGEIWMTFPDRQLGYIDASKTAQKAIAVRFFSTAANYVSGDFVVQAGGIWVANTSITAGAFNPSQWRELAYLTDIPAIYVLPIASTSALGGVKVDGVTVKADASGVLTAAGLVTVSSVAPSPVQNGALWYDLVGGQLYTWVNDGSSSQWVIAVNQSAGGLYLPLNGGILTGDLHGTTATFSGVVNAYSLTANSGSVGIDGPAGTGRNLGLSTNGVNRWLIAGGPEAETGSNVGSNFSVNACDDTGAPIWTPLQINRKTGQVLIKGVTDGLDAPAGYVGEVISSSIPQPGLGMVSATPKTITSIALTAGDWDVQGELWVINSGAGLSAAIGSISDTNNTLNTSQGIATARNTIANTTASMGSQVLPLRPCRVSLSAPATYYLVGQTTFPSGTVTMHGNIWARRAR